MPLVIGLTGGIGSGKSSAAALFAQLGADVIDTDEIAHQLTAPGAPALARIAQTFGAEMLLPNGTLDRAALRRRVFSDAAARATLEAILHPRIRQETLARMAASTAPYAMVVVPLLLETPNYRTLVQRVVVVDCTEAQQVARVMSRSPLSEAEVRAIMAAQIKRPARLAQADEVLDNSGDPDALARQVQTLHANYLKLCKKTP